jgi:excisionase family DNA binding protein
MDEKADQHNVATYLGVSTRTVRNLVRRGELPVPIRIGRRRFWLKERVTRWRQDDRIAPTRRPSAKIAALMSCQGTAVRPRMRHLDRNNECKTTQIPQFCRTLCVP